MTEAKMQIQINRDSNFEGREKLAAHVSSPRQQPTSAAHVKDVVESALNRFDEWKSTSATRTATRAARTTNVA
jgi:hypothetical protein